MINLDAVLKDRDLIRIFRNNYYERVYDLLGKYVKKYELDSQERLELQNRLFIEYMKITALKRKDNHVYERILVGILENYEFKDIIIYILNQDINLTYRIINSKNMRTPLINILATRIKDKDIMKLLLTKITKLGVNYFENNYTKENMDLCRMNIIAGNLKEAYNIFNDSNYKIIKNNLDLDKILKENCQIELDNFNYKEDDLLYQIILTINDSDIDNTMKKKLLITILKNSKVKVLNTKLINIIREILEENLFKKFLEYLEESKIVLYNISLTNERVIYLDNIDNIKEKIKIKSLI